MKCSQDWDLVEALDQYRIYYGNAAKEVARMGADVNDVLNGMLGF